MARVPLVHGGPQTRGAPAMDSFVKPSPMLEKHGGPKERHSWEHLRQEGCGGQNSPGRCDWGPHPLCL